MRAIRAYLYFIVETVEDREGFVMLKQAMLNDLSDHILQLGQKGFLFLTRKAHKRVSDTIKEKSDRPFFLIDITDGINSQKFNTNIDIEDIKKRLYYDRPDEITVNGVLEKILLSGYDSLTMDEKDYLQEMSKK